MRGVAAVVFFGLVVCAVGAAVTPASASSKLPEWQTSAGTPPSKNEFAAVIAACKDRATKSANEGSSIERCLADYGLRRVQ